ncbi:MAG: HEAT repeat domain-containing protein [Paludibacteraceae bacterium]|jgi:hypothetical protein|nr:HEAT repeat domain-containing protein [Paludibacteraceae bacterium]
MMRLLPYILPLVYTAPPSGPGGPNAYFYGWEVLTYVRYLVDAYLRQYSWQVQTSLVIITLCSLMILILAAVFTQRMMSRNKRDRLFELCSARFEEPFREVLAAKEKWPHEEIEYVCKVDTSALQTFDPATFARLIVKIRLEHSNEVFLPNMQRLCNMTGVQAFMEYNMVKGRNVEMTLQILITLPIRISEGALAAYTGSRSRRTRELARSYYGFCSKTEPFHYVMQDVNESFQMWYPTMLHRLVGWHHAKGHPVPRFLTLAQQSENSERKALFISEIPYWGDEREKRGIREYLTSPDPKCRSAAIQALAIIGDPDSEAELVANYTFQFPEAKRETLLAVAKINTGKQTEFFKEAYLQSSSQNTRAVALSCLFNYGPEGRKAFHELAHVGLDDSKFFEQIESTEAKAEGKELKMRV